MQLAEARKLPATAAVPVGTHLSVPIRLSDGGIYGTFCCFSRAANCALNARDIATMRCFAGITAKFIEQQVAEEKRREEILARQTAVLNAEHFAIVWVMGTNQCQRIVSRREPRCRLRSDASFRILWCPMNLGRWIYEISLATEVLIAMVGVVGVAAYAWFVRNGHRSISEIKGEE